MKLIPLIFINLQLFFCRLHADNKKDSTLSKCPSLEGCLNYCPFGRYKNKLTGCLTCGCSKKGIFQGDIAIEESYYDEFFKKYGFLKEKSTHRIRRGAFKQSFRHWPKSSSGTVVPYTIHSSISDIKRKGIMESIEEFNSKTCIKFQERIEERDYIMFYGQEQGCSSQLGRVGGYQKIRLGDECFRKGNILHEMMHALGFAHEQARPDRDDHVIINWDNIMKGAENNFAKELRSNWNSYSSPYDINSLMHYGPFFYSKSRDQPTITDKEGKMFFYNRETFSEQDLVQINRKYQCSDNYLNMASEMNPQEPQIVDEKKDKIEELICEDRKSLGYCRYYAERNQCNKDKIKAYLKVFCIKTCGFCNITKPLSNQNTTSNKTSSTKDITEKNIRYNNTTTLKSKTNYSTKPNTSKATTILPFTETATTQQSTNSFYATKKNKTLSSGQDGTCSDLSKNCKSWVKLDYCTNLKQKYKMRETCKKSCGFCEKTSMTSKKISTTLSSQDVTCFDTHQKCESWASHGLCTRNVYHNTMMRHCRKSCGVCQETKFKINQDKTKNSCHDKRSFCPKWAQMNRCENIGYKEYMIKNCLLSCKICNKFSNKKVKSGIKTEHIKKNETFECLDKNRSCAKWFARGLCGHPYYKTYSKTVCKKSCNLCDSV